MTAQTKELTDRYLDDVSRLFESYLQKFPKERERLSVLSGQFDARDRLLCNRGNMRGHLTASGLLLNAKGDCVFLIYHNFLKLWLQPGGHLDVEELPVDGAMREFIEETGIKGIRLHDWHSTNSIPFDMDTHAIPPNSQKNEGDHFHHDFQYLLSLKVEPVVVNIARDEVSHHRWVSLDELISSDHDPRLKRVATKVRAFVSLSK